MDQPGNHAHCRSIDTRLPMRTLPLLPHTPRPEAALHSLYCFLSISSMHQRCIYSKFDYLYISTGTDW